jgi:hypothetical protein
MVETQIGPPPPIHATPGMHLQYHLLRRMRLKSHVIDALSSLIESLAMVSDLQLDPAAQAAARPSQQPAATWAAGARGEGAACGRAPTGARRCGRR